MKARDLMTQNPDCVTPDDSIQHAASLMRDHDIGAIPVVSDTDSRTLVGIVTDRDIAVKHVASGHDGSCSVECGMTHGELATVREDDDTDRVMELMRSHQVRRIPVTDEEKHVVGMIAQADLAVDMGEDREVERTVEAISEPARPAR